MCLISHGFFASRRSHASKRMYLCLFLKKNRTRKKWPHFSQPSSIGNRLKELENRMAKERLIGSGTRSDFCDLWKNNKIYMRWQANSENRLIRWRDVINFTANRIKDFYHKQSCLTINYFATANSNVAKQLFIRQYNTRVLQRIGGYVAPGHGGRRSSNERHVGRRSGSGRRAREPRK